MARATTNVQILAVLITEPFALRGAPSYAPPIVAVVLGSGVPFKSAIRCPSLKTVTGPSVDTTNASTPGQRSCLACVKSSSVLAGMTTDREDYSPGRLAPGTHEDGGRPGPKRLRG